ncbi:hypothetical protein [Xanthomonas translucens]|uniref:hypothetical protein n=1 Tax=Xanthomonas campestris pv. translucens TaxID=343 RepID=UPI001F3210A1|nr:hypothetical protein [Xanthomonas translucens]UJB14601.1 hypothetical protein LTC53_16875 [Xanthomonas translucens pv. undulosa]
MRVRGGFCGALIFFPIDCLRSAALRKRCAVPALKEHVVRASGRRLAAHAVQAAVRNAGRRSLANVAEFPLQPAAHAAAVIRVAGAEAFA